MQPESSQAGLPVGVIGLGSMGMGVARSLLRAGLLVSGYDIRPEARRQFEELGGVAASCPGEAGRHTRAVVILVVNAEQTEEVIFGAGGLAERMEPGSVIVTSSTVPPAFAADLGHRHLRASRVMRERDRMSATAGWGRPTMIVPMRAHPHGWQP